MQPVVAMESDASHMLEAALEQMDDIIAGSKAAAEYSNGLLELGSPSSCSVTGPLQVLQLAEELRLALELQSSREDRDSLRAQVPSSTLHTLLLWLDSGEVNLQSPVNNESYQERLARLEGDKESLVLQVSVLTDQVEAQGEKIRDLESSLEEHHNKLVSTEEMLQQELLSRTSLESQKLDLMDEVSYLKLRLVGLDEEQHPPQPSDDSQNKAEGLLQELRLLKSKVDELEGEKTQYERKLKATKTEIMDLQQLLSSKDAEIKSLHSQLLAKGSSTNDTTDKDQEFHRLKMGMESLLASNEEKDRHIEELTVLLGQYRRMKEVLALTQAGDRIQSGSSEEELSGLKLRALTHKAHSDIIRCEMSSRGSSPLFVSPLSFPRELDSSCRSFQTSIETSLVSPRDAGFHNAAWSQPRMLSSSLEELQSGSLPKHEAEQPVQPVSDSENRHQDIDKYQTLPGKLSREVVNGRRETYASPVQLSPVESDDNDYNLRRPERPGEAALSDLSPLSSGADSGKQSPVSPENRKSTKGIRKLWGKIRRSQSGTMQGEDPDLVEFRRGGTRATAGPRLARTKDTLTSLRDQKTPFSRWTPDQVCDWLEDSGLGQYVTLARQWVTSGQTLVSATHQDLEKELGIKNPLHRKKVQLAVKSLSSKQAEKSSELDHLWVTRWLDDIGLPQYKDQFNEGRVDGRVLQYLTVNDLLFLKVTSQLHHLSIRCAIHVLHVNKFNPHCLKRRPGDENMTSPSEVVQWSNHRVMEWLRSVDLAEYAPNLRGSGVHGGLIILEPRFNSDTLAMLLNIPPQKTLLRRHLATNFSSLVGSSAQLEKRDYTESSGHSPLSTTAKVKAKKMGFSTLRRRKTDDSTDYLCPLETQSQTQGQSNGAQRPYAGFRGLSPILDRDPERRDQVGHHDDS